MYYTLAYVTGSIIILLALVNFIFPSRKISLILKLSIDAMSVLNLVFVMLATNNQNVLVGIVTTSLGAVRDIIFIFRDKSKYLDHIAWPIGLSVIFACSLIFTYKSPISILPVVGSVASTMTLYARNQKILKFGALCCQALYIIYFGILIPTSDVLTVFSLVSSMTGFIGTVVGLIVLFHQDKNKKNIEENTGK